MYDQHKKHAVPTNKQLALLHRKCYNMQRHLHRSLFQSSSVACSGREHGIYFPASLVTLYHVLKTSWDNSQGSTEEVGSCGEARSDYHQGWDELILLGMPQPKPGRGNSTPGDQLDLGRMIFVKKPDRISIQSSKNPKFRLTDKRTREMDVWGNLLQVTKTVTLMADTPWAQIYKMSKVQA